MSDKKEVLAQLQAISEAMQAEFTDPRDHARVDQAASAIATAQMAIGHLHDTRQNRRDLVKAHEAEAKAGGRYAEERKRSPDMYENHYPNPEHDRPAAAPVAEAQA